MDYIALRLILFAAAYLLYLPKFEKRATVLLLAAVTLAIAMLTLHLFHAVRYERFCEREWNRIRRQLLCDRLLLLPMQLAIPLVSSLCPPETTPVVLQRALPVDANALLAVVRTHGGCGELHIFTCTAYDDTAKAFAARTNGMLVLHPASELQAAAEEASMRPDDEAVFSAILSELSNEKKHRRNGGFRQFVTGSALKYFLIAAGLFALSFITDYALYYRLLSGLCMSFAAFTTLRRRNAEPH